MTPRDLLTYLEAEGISVTLKLRLEGDTAPSIELLELLKVHKHDLITHLATATPLLCRLREEGMLFHAREGKLQPKSEEHAAYAEVLEQETARYLSWAAKLLDTYPYVMLESPLPWREGYVIASHFKDVGKLAERRIWLDAWAMWGVLTYQNEVLEAWGEDAYRQLEKGEMETAA